MVCLLRTGFAAVYRASPPGKVGRTGWPTAWFDAKRSTPSVESRISQTGSSSYRSNGSPLSPALTPSITQPVLDGHVRDFSDWAMRSSKPYPRDASIENSPTISASEPATVDIQSAQYPSPDSRSPTISGWRCLIRPVGSFSLYSQSGWHRTVINPQVGPKSESTAPWSLNAHPLSQLREQARPLKRSTY